MTDAGQYPEHNLQVSDRAWFAENHGQRLRWLRDRSRILSSIREFFAHRGFVEVETPTMVPSPGLDLHLEAFEVRGYREARWLSTSPEYQMKRLLSAGLPRIVQIGRAYRREEEGAHHQPEFTMLEWYRANAGSEDMMEDTEALVAHVTAAIHGGSELPGRRGPLNVEGPWPRLTIREAFDRYANVAFERLLGDENVFFRVFVEQVEPQLAEQGPLFLTEWPASMASLARLLPDRPGVADRFEAFLGGLELCNGFGELTDAQEQRERLERDQRLRRDLGRPCYPVDERFVEALAEGMPPSGGNALGVDRLVMRVLGADRIDDVVAFPQSRL